jgi:hypothetical protein
MKDSELQSYISNLPIGLVTISFGVEEEPPVGAIDPDRIPDGVVTGTNMVEFDGAVDADLRTAVALSLLAAQRVATNDVVVTTPDQWLDRHNTVLTNLNWMLEGGGKVEQTFEKINVEVHDAIIPFLTVALGGAVGASSLIVTALKQLKQVNKNSPWITLFLRESQRFGVSEFHFTHVAVEENRVVLKLAAARFDAYYDRTQVLFFKITKQNAKFQMANSSMLADSQLLRMSRDGLKTKLARLTDKYVRELDIGE